MGGRDGRGGGEGEMGGAGGEVVRERWEGLEGRG